MNMGKKIKEALRIAGISQTELAKELNMSRQQITNIVLGKSNPSIKVLLKIIELTRKDANYFFDIFEGRTTSSNNVIGNYNRNINQNINTNSNDDLEEIRNDIFLLKRAVKELLRREGKI